ncbi:MAG: LCP family protein [Firmicutes bacterium]|nr:LCP family protein [Bacillota bacterium]
MDRSYWMRRLCFALVCLLLIGIICYSGFRILEATVLFDREEDHNEPAYVSKTIERDGIKYFPKQDIETFLIVGVDQDGPMKKTAYEENNIMADALMVLVFDKTKEKVDVVTLNRDTMTEIPVLDADGSFVGSITAQLAVSYAYGNGIEKSAENTKKAVSDLLYGIEIDHYVALTMDAVKILNDAVGGVTVEVLDDFSAVDPDITYGYYTLYGDEALTFVRARKDVGEHLNLNRMDRQAEYMECFYDALKIALEDNPEFAVDTYEELESYMVTDCSVTTMAAMLDRYNRYEMGEFIVPEGENREGEKYMEFYLEEEAFQQMVLEKFYAEKK